jgi:hypothetical protein
MIVNYNQMNTEKNRQPLAETWASDAGMTCSGREPQSFPFVRRFRSHPQISGLPGTTGDRTKSGCNPQSRRRPVWLSLSHDLPGKRVCGKGNMGASVKTSQGIFHPVLLAGSEVLPPKTPRRYQASHVLIS